jgi:hypothetical protein
METQQELLFDPATVVLDILVTARVVQNEKNELVHVKKQYLEGDQIDAFVQLLAKDMAYLLKIQGENHLLTIEGERLPPEKDDFTAFQAFLIKNYGNA